MKHNFTNRQLFEVTAKTLTPVYVGSGNEIMPYEYFIDVKSNTLYRFDTAHFWKSLNASDRNELQELIENHNDLNDGYIRIRNRIFKLISGKQEYFEWVKEYASWKQVVTQEFAELYDEHIKQEHQTNESNMLIIDELPKTFGFQKTYLPGSSLKGALRTAISRYFMEGHIGKEEDNIALRKLNIPEDPFRSFLVSDSEPIANNSIQVGLFKREKITGIHEYLKRGETFTFDIQPLRRDILRRIDKEGRHIMKHMNNLSSVDMHTESFSIKHIVQACNSYLEEKLKNSIDRIQEMLDHPDIKGDGSDLEDLLRKKQEQLKDEIFSKFKDLRDNEFLLQIGYGGGFLTKTLLENEFLEKDLHQEEAKPKKVKYKVKKSNKNSFISHEIKERDARLTHPKYIFDAWEHQQKWRWAIENGESAVKLFHKPPDEIHAPRTHWTIDGSVLGFVKCKISEK